MHRQRAKKRYICICASVILCGTLFDSGSRGSTFALYTSSASATIRGSDCEVNVLLAVQTHHERRYIDNLFPDTACDLMVS